MSSALAAACLVSQPPACPVLEQRRAQRYRVRPVPCPVQAATHPAVEHGIFRKKNYIFIGACGGGCNISFFILLFLFYLFFLKIDF